MKIKNIIFIVACCFVLYEVILGILKCSSYANNKSSLFVVSTEYCGWNTITEKPTRINGLSNIWQIRINYKDRNFVAFGNCEQPTNHWQIGDEVLIIAVQSDPSVFFSPPIYFFTDHKKK
jgi:hypothetical protein